MKTEDQAWRDLQRQAAAQLRPDFANRVLHTAHGPDAAVWRQLNADAAAQLRPGFADRVLRAARALPLPPLFDQLALGAATIALCLLGVVFVHEHSLRQEEQRNLAGWRRLATATEYVDLTR